MGQAEKCRIQSAGRDAADGTHLGCEHHALQPLLCRHRGYALRHADAQIGHRTGGQFHGRPPGNDLPRTHRQRGQSIQRGADLSGKGGVILGAEGLHVVLRPGHHKRIHIDTGEADEPCVQAAVGDHLLHLDNDPAAGVMGGLRLGQGLGVDTLPLKGTVAALVGIGRADNCDINGEGGIKELFLALQLNQLDHIARFMGGAVHLSALQAGVHKGVQADMGDHAGPLRGDLPEQPGDDTLGEVVGRQLILRRQPSQLGRQAPVSADHRCAHPVYSQVVKPPLAAVALPGRIHDPQPSRVSTAPGGLLQRNHNLLRMHQTVCKAAERHSCPIVKIGVYRLAGG